MVLGVALLILGSAATVGVISATDADNSRPGQVGRVTQMEQTGEMQTLWERHRQMLMRMQNDVSPAMLQEMKADPMWQMLRSDDWIRMDEEHQADINRMLGRPQPAVGR